MRAKIEEKIVNFAFKLVYGMKRGWLLILLMALVACTKETVPEEYLSEPELAQVLLDIYVAEGMMAFKNTPHKAIDVYGVYKEVILEKYGLTDSIYRSNMNYYITHPQFLDKVYDIMIDSLKLRQQTLPDEGNRAMQ